MAFTRRFQSRINPQSNTGYPIRAVVGPKKELPFLLLGKNHPPLGRIRRFRFSRLSFQKSDEFLLKIGLRVHRGFHFGEYTIPHLARIVGRDMAGRRMRCEIPVFSGLAFVFLE